MEKFPRVCAVVLNITDTPGLVECLLSLDKAAYENFEVIVVHNGPRNEGFESEVRRASAKVSEVVFTGFNAGFAAGTNAGIRRAVAAAWPVRMLQSPVNIGYAAGNNLGIRDACARGADYILLLNDDTVVDPDFLETLVEAGEQAPDVGALGPVILYFDEPTKISFAGAEFDQRECDVRSLDDGEWAAGAGPVVKDSDYVTGCCVLMKRGTLDRVGLLDERFFLYWEDTDWGLRVKASGLRNVVVSAARIWHRVSVSSGGVGSPLRVYHKTRSHLFFARRHAPDALPKLHGRFMRDVAWLVLKSRIPRRLSVARAVLLAVRDFHLQRTGAGPGWLWRKR